MLVFVLPSLVEKTHLITIIQGLQPRLWNRNRSNRVKKYWSYHRNWIIALENTTYHCGS